MQKTLIKVLTSNGIFETDLTLKEAKDAVALAKTKNEMLALPLNWATAYLNIDGENCPVINDKTTLLDLSELKILGYSENTYKTIEKEDEDN